MTKTQYTINIILFVPLLIINFFAYGVQGDIDFIKELKKERQRHDA